MNLSNRSADVFVGAVTEGARMLAERVEQELHRSDDRSEEPRVEILWTCLMFVIHLTDRVAFAHLRSDSRNSFMSRILEILAEKIDEDTLRTEYNSAQRRWSSFKQLLPDKGQGTRGTLFWEFSKSICEDYNDMNPALAMLLSLHAAKTFEALEETFREHVLQA